SMICAPPRRPRFPYTTLFRSGDGGVTAAGALAGILPAAVGGITGSATNDGGLTATLPVLTGQSTGSAVTTASLDGVLPAFGAQLDRKSTRLNSSHVKSSYAVC